MGLRALLAPLAAAAVCLAAAPSPAAPPPPTVLVSRADVRFGRQARLSLRGDLTAFPGLGALDPTGDRVVATLGPAVLLDAPGQVGRVRARSSPDSLRFVLRGPFGGEGAATFQVRPSTGEFRLTARGFDAEGLHAAGPGPLEFSIRIGDATAAFAFALEASPRGDRWKFRLPIPAGALPDEYTPFPDHPDLPPAIQTSWLYFHAGGADGMHSQISTRSVRFARTQEQWNALWAEHGGIGAPPAIKSFKSRMVVGFFLGLKPTSEHAPWINSAAHDGRGNIVIEFVELHATAQNCYLPKVPSTPFAFFEMDNCVGAISWTIVPGTIPCIYVAGGPPPGPPVPD